MLNSAQPIGPNVRRLISERAAQLQCDSAKERFGQAGFAEIAALMAERGVGGLQANLREAHEWVMVSLKALRNAPGSEQWPTDEDMAGELMRRIEAKRRLHRWAT
jgi:hypothetical protein